MRSTGPTPTCLTRAVFAQVDREVYGVMRTDWQARRENAMVAVVAMDRDGSRESPSRSPAPRLERPDRSASNGWLVPVHDTAEASVRHPLRMKVDEQTDRDA